MAAFRLDRCRRLDLAATDPISGALPRGRGAHDRLRARPLHDRRRAIFARSLRRGSGAACNESSSSMSTQLLLTQEIGRAHVWTPVTNAHLVCRLLLETNKHITHHQQHMHTHKTNIYLSKNQ